MLPIHPPSKRSSRPDTSRRCDYILRINYLGIKVSSIQNLSDKIVALSNLLEAFPDILISPELIDNETLSEGRVGNLPMNQR